MQLSKSTIKVIVEAITEKHDELPKERKIKFGLGESISLDPEGGYLCSLDRDGTELTNLDESIKKKIPEKIYYFSFL